MAAATLPRLATRADLDAVVGLYEGARRFMAHNGNPTQWAGGYPGRAEAERDLAAGGLWVLDAPDGGLAGVMSMLPGPDPTYARIEGAGFSRRGTIWVEDGTSRIAYHHVATGA